MARMVPDFLDPSVAASERRVFEALRSAPGTDNWTVLHSLGLCSEWTGEFGEIDFVVILPGFGIVCIEVKGGSVASTNGTWTTRNRRGEVEILRRSPYRQAQDGMWKLLSAIRTRFGSNSQEARCPVGWLVIFPDVISPPVTPEAGREDIIDRDDIDGDIAARIRLAPSLVRLLSRPDLVRPAAATCDRIVRFLRPDFERVAAPASSDWDAEVRIRTLTEEQFDALDSIADNRVSLIRGPAGTGKTLVGLESARRAAAAGRNALVLCFNHNLGNWLAAAVRAFAPRRVVAGNVHALLRERIIKSSFADDLVGAETSNLPTEDLFGQLYYELGALAIEESGERFDAIVFDEVQDLAARAVGDLVRAWSRAGEGSRVLLLGDFTRQALYAGSSSTSVSLLEAALGPLAIFNLRLNCRNTRRIALQTGILSGFGEQRVSERQPEGEQVSLQYYSTRTDGLACLDRLIALLRQAGQKPADVIVLGPRRRDSSLLRNLQTIGGWKVHDFAGGEAGYLAYSTIHAFKGLERPVVILIDIEAASRDEADALLYVAMSRARLRLFILARETARPGIEERLATGALAAAGLRSS